MESELVDSVGPCRFLPHTDLGMSVDNNCQYLKDDCLVFCIVSVKIN